MDWDSTGEEDTLDPESGDGFGDEGNLDGSVVLKKGPWTEEEDVILRNYVENNGEGNWNAVQKFSGLSRCGKSCRLRWVNHLRPNLKKTPFTPEEERIVVEIHAKEGNKWALMATKIPGRSDNDIKNFWHTRAKKLQRAGLPLYPPDVRIETQNESQQIQPSTTFSSSHISGPHNSMGASYIEFEPFKIKGSLPLPSMSDMLPAIGPQGSVPFNGFSYASVATMDPQGLVAPPCFSHTYPTDGIGLDVRLLPQDSILTYNGLRDTANSYFEGQGKVDHSVLQQLHQQQPRPYDLGTVNDLYSTTDHQATGSNAVMNAYFPSISEPGFESTMFEPPSIQNQMSVPDFSFLSVPSSTCPSVLPAPMVPSQLQSNTDNVQLVGNADDVNAFLDIDSNETITDYIFDYLNSELDIYDQGTNLMDPFDSNASMPFEPIPEYTSNKPRSSEVHLVSEAKTSVSPIVPSQTGQINNNSDGSYQPDNPDVNEWFV